MRLGAINLMFLWVLPVAPFQACKLMLKWQSRTSMCSIPIPLSPSKTLFCLALLGQEGCEQIFGVKLFFFASLLLSFSISKSKHLFNPIISVSYLDGWSIILLPAAAILLSEGRELVAIDCSELNIKLSQLRVQELNQIKTFSADTYFSDNRFRQTRSPGRWGEGTGVTDMWLFIQAPLRCSSKCCNLASVFISSLCLESSINR